MEIKYAFVTIDGERLPARVIKDDTVVLLNWSDRDYHTNLNMRSSFKAADHAIESATWDDVKAWEPAEPEPKSAQDVAVEPLYREACVAISDHSSGEMGYGDILFVVGNLISRAYDAGLASKQDDPVNLDGSSWQDERPILLCAMEEGLDVMGSAIDPRVRLKVLELHEQAVMIAYSLVWDNTQEAKP